MYISFTDYFLSLEYDRNIEGSKFKIGETVKYIGNLDEYRDTETRKRRFEVAAMNLLDTNDDGTLIIEYALYGFPYLVWEEDIEKV